MTVPSSNSLASEIDRACIDLMNRRRAGKEVVVEDYLKQFPQLNNDEHLLDLIDADLCVNAEIGVTEDAISDRVDQYLKQYPRLKSQINELFQLQDQVAASPRGIAESFDTSSQNPVHQTSAQYLRGHDATENSTRPDQSIADSPTHDHASNDHVPLESKLVDHPLFDHPLTDLPEWFEPRQCVSRGIDHWLIRGQDAARGKPLALKIIKLPFPIDTATANGLLDACEAASKVTNSHWGNPIIATVQNQTYGVIRPWWFGHPMPQECTPETLIKMSTIAFALAAAHRSGASHGGVHAGNVVVDHQGQWKLVDAVASQAGLPAYLNDALSPTGQSPCSAADLLSQSQRQDVKDLTRLIGSVLLLSDDSRIDATIAKLRHVSRDSRDGAANLGEVLLNEVDCIYGN